VNKKVTPKQSNQDLAQQVEEAELLQEQMNQKELMDANEQHELSGYTDQRDLANQLMGRIQMTLGFKKMAAVASLTDLAYVKEHKLYKALAGKQLFGSDGEKVANIATWEGYCKALGTSRRKVDEDLMNLATFGDEALEAMNKAGIGYRQMRQLRKLPEKELTIVVNEVEANVGDKDAILGLIEDMSIKHAKEKESLQQQVEQSQSQNEANERFLQAKEQKINDLEKVVSKSLTPDEEKQRHSSIEAELKSELESAVASCAINMDRLNVVMEKVFMYDKGTEELRSQPLNQYDYLLRHMVDVGIQNQLKFDAKNIFAPLMFMLDGFTPDESQG